ncbi:kinase [Azospirillum sp. Vi22]|uniref:GHMP family kinase ATP-binding protein n=1 Tax=Azospirillum baldaniorum TaxID=1064539 RepID=UPI00157AB9F6|nr:kinase [Azospirillum baldaniorum]NUB04611.1 kinase [Azospirillum baldaniorum]
MPGDVISRLAPIRLGVGGRQRKEQGFGRVNGHHGEILQGIFPDETGRLHRGLVTLPCNIVSSAAVFRPAAGPLVTVPDDKRKAADAARLALDTLGLHDQGGYLTVESDIPVGLGMGSSTADVVAAIRAVADAHGAALGADEVARLAVRAETASDSIMHGDLAVLFAQREGVVLEHLGPALPTLEVLSVDTSPGSPVDTLKQPAAVYDEWEIQAFRPLRGMLRRAIRTGDATLLGRVATASARISQRHLPKPAFEEINAIAASIGALGIQVAHSGTVVGLLFDPRNPATARRIAEAAARLKAFGLPPAFHFRTDAAEVRHVA